MSSSIESEPLTNLGWVRPATAVAALAYTGTSILTLCLLPGNSWAHGQNIVTAGLCWGAFFWAAAQPRQAALFAIGVIGLELTEVIFHAGEIDVSTPLVFPVLVVTIGVLRGTGAMGGALMVAACAIVLACLSGRMMRGLPIYDTENIFQVAIVEIELFAAVFLGRTVLLAYQKLLSETERARQRYHQLFEHAPDGLVELEEQGRIVEANPVALKLLGLTATDSAGRPLSAVLQAAGFATDLDFAAANGSLPLVVELARETGTRFIEIATRPQPGPRARLLLVIRDTSARRLLEARQEQAQRLETVGRLAGGIAHDFNNLLTAIGGNAGLLQDHADPEVGRMAGYIFAAQQRAAHLVRQLMSFAQHDYRQPKVISLLREAEDWSDMLRRQTADHCRLEIGGDEQGLVLADEVQIQRILLNLISNARDASPQGAVVGVRFRRLARKEAAGLGSPLGAERQVAIEVSDHGCGMTAEVKGRLFEPFFTTKPQGKGTGLGLAAVHGLVAQNDGAIEIKSTLDQGTTVSIFFPEAVRG